jgi:DNA primase
MDETVVLERIRHGADGASPPERQGHRARNAPLPRPDPRDPSLIIEREVVKLGIQRPALAGPVFDALGEECFTSPAYATVRAAIAKAGGAARASSGAEWVGAVQEAAETDAVRDLVTELAVESMQSMDDGDPRYAKALLVRLEEMALTRRIEEMKSKLQRLNPVDQAEAYNRMFGELIVLERQKKGLREQGMGEL